MKTFDLAVNYLRWVDLSKADIFSDPPQQGGGICTATGEPMPEPVYPEWYKKMIQVHEAFKKDPQNPESNETYRDTCFECALYHHLDLAHNRHPTCWTTALGIVTQHNYGALVRIFQKKWGGTIYPYAMMKDWQEYCIKQDPQPFYLHGELTPEILFTAYHYVIDKKS